MARNKVVEEIFNQNAAPDAQFSVPSTSEGRREELMRRFEDVQNTNQGVTELRKINTTRLQATKTRLIQALFRMMKDLGVDPTDLESINEFLRALDQQDPDLRELFEVSFNTLISDQEVNPQATTARGELFGRQETLADQAFRPR